MTESQFRRPHFFNGKLLTAADLDLEQQYHREKSKLHNRALHGFGIVSGLKVSVDAGQIVIEPGLALDCEGNEILIAALQTVVPPVASDCYASYVNLLYAEENTDPVPGGETSTIIETFELTFGPENCNRGHRHQRARWLACGQPHALTIAKLKRAAHGWRVERGYRSPVVK
ncbi:MAG TPA: hypothetical protein VGO56_05715 [Pyrinomonadaceae bacterium]|jgi:hypothetical protein|nr:hypothetical protein [Pyrinomonadaceae bacterium]